MNLKQFMDETGISFNELSRRLDVSNTTVRFIYYDWQDPSPDVLRKLIIYSKGVMTANDLLGITDQVIKSGNINLRKIRKKQSQKLSSQGESESS